MQSVQVKQPGHSCPLSLVPFGDDVVVPSSEKSRQVFYRAQCRTLFQFLLDSSLDNSFFWTLFWDKTDLCLNIFKANS